MDVSDNESDQELSILTPPDIVNKAKTVKTAGLLQEKIKTVVSYENCYDFVYEMVQKREL
jgi:hypothetical protein